MGWGLGDVCALNLDEMLNRYQRDWGNTGVLADLIGTEKDFLDHSLLSGSGCVFWRWNLNNTFSWRVSLEQIC